MWGTNTKGSLLVESTESIVWEPSCDVMPSVWNTLDGPIDQIVCGATDTAVITTSGSVYVAGENKQGQCGVGHTNPVLQLTKIEGIPPVASISLGSTHSAIITKDGQLYTFGFGGSLVSGMGCLGHGNGDSYYKPTLVESLVEDGCLAKSVVIGEAHTTVLTTEGEVLTTGASAYGVLGNGETSVDQLYLEPAELLSPTGVSQIAGGKSFSLALQDGVIYGWGRNHKGQLGTGFGMAVDMYSMEQVPCQMDSDELINRVVTKIAAGHSHAACITSSGELFIWGMSLHLEPVRVAEVLHTKIVDVVCGRDYTMALSDDGHIYIWGFGRTGVLGLGKSTKTANQPQLLRSLADHHVVAMSAGWAHAACLVQDK